MSAFLDTDLPAATLASARAGDPAAQEDIYVMHVDGSGLRRKYGPETATKRRFGCPISPWTTKTLRTSPPPIMFDMFSAVADHGPMRRSR